MRSRTFCLRQAWVLCCSHFFGDPRAQTIKAVRGTIATKGMFDNWKLLAGPSVPLPGASVSLAGLFSLFICWSRAWLAWLVSQTWPRSPRHADGSHWQPAPKKVADEMANLSVICFSLSGCAIGAAEALVAEALSNEHWSLPEPPSCRSPWSLRARDKFSFAGLQIFLLKCYRSLKVPFGPNIWEF